MKKLSLTGFCFLLAIQSLRAQVMMQTHHDSLQQLHAVYIQKYKSFRNAGRFFLGSGIAITLISGIVFANYAGQGFNGPDPGTGETLLFFVGPGLALTSIPFFIQAKKNKTKAELVLKNESANLGNRISYQTGYAALTLRINF